MILKRLTSTVPGATSAEWVIFFDSLSSYYSAHNIDVPDRDLKMYVSAKNAGIISGKVALMISNPELIDSLYDLIQDKDISIENELLAREMILTARRKVVTEK